MNGSGFVDLQVNGFGGINFSDPGLTMSEIRQVMRAQARLGTLAFCPTVITAEMIVYRRVLQLLDEALREQSGWGEGCWMPGIHLEGPFISPEDGAVGVHPRQYVQPPDAERFAEIFEMAGGKIALLTLAPELPGALELIARAVELGVAVSIGHTLADAAAVRAAVAAGARLSTHLGNGCPNWLHRHHNPIWPQLAAPELTAMLITDGHHLPPEVIAAFLAAKRPGRVIVTSDAAPAAGCPPGEYAFFGSRVLLEPSGRLRNLERDTLAGSAASMLDCMNHLAGLGLLSEADLWRVGRDQPLAAIGRTRADLPAAGPVRFVNGRFVLEQTLPEQ